MINLNIDNTYTVKSTVIFYFHDQKKPVKKPNSQIRRPYPGGTPLLLEGTPAIT
jgi:hypothetical protein